MVQTVGATRAGRPRPTRRGAGIPGRPPAVWVNVTDDSETSGAGWRSGSPWAWNVNPIGPTRMCVLFRTPPPRLAVVDDATVVHLDPRGQVVGEPEPVVVAEPQARAARSDQAGRAS